MGIAEGWRRRGRYGTVGAAVVLLVACTSSRGPSQLAGSTTTTSSSTSSSLGGDAASPATATSAPGTAASTSPTSSSSEPPTSRAAQGVVMGSAVAGASGAVETRPPYRNTDPFSEAVRLRDRTCVGWSGSRGGSTDGLATGARVLILHSVRDEEIGRGRIERSRWEDVSNGGRQWNCFFDFTATLTGRAPREFRILVAGLQPWLASPDPNDPDTFVASVSTGADIGLIASCPPVPDPDARERPRRTTTTDARRMSSRWHAIGQYWSRGVDSLCRAGLPVTAIARPCRPPRVGSEYISAVVDSNDSTVTYRDGERVRVGTQVTAVVATAHPCD